jgi:cell wall-associated NlpC family hydrolase
MHSGRQTSETKPRSGRVRAAALVAALNRLASPKRVLALGLVCGALLGLTALASVASAVPSVRLGGSAKTQVGSLEAQAQELQAQIADLDKQLEASSEAYNQLVVQLDEYNVRMISLRQQLDVAQRDYQYRLKLYEVRLCDLYKAGGQDEFLQMILEANDVGDFFTRARLAAEFADQDRRLMQSLTRSADRLDQILVQMDQAKAQQLVIRKQMTDEQDRITATLTARQDALASVDAQITAIIEAERQRQAEEQQRLQQTLAAILNGGQVYNGTLPQTGNEITNQFLQTAAAYVGIAYVWGGDRPSTGMDCSGYTQYVYKQHGVTLPHYSGYQAVMGLPVDLASIQAGDLLAFGFPVHHVGIYIGEDLFLHAAGTGLDIRVGRLSERDDVSAIRRFDLKARTGAPDFN